MYSPRKIGEWLKRSASQEYQAAYDTIMYEVYGPQGVALPVLGCAVWVRLDASLSNYEAARISIAPVGPKPPSLQTKRI